jgi:hypothetical protein
MATKVSKSLIQTEAGDAGKVLTSDGSTLSWSSNRIAKAWVNFNGNTNPPTIRDSYNVSSVTKSGTGIYLINFSNPMVDANYSISPGGGNNLVWSNQLTRTTTQFQLQSGYVSSTTGAMLPQDSTTMYAVVFGN